tara:strand:+ start:449 stop:2368 length:1920 start_codon:yes stop_codon:yes gene_type:complete
MAITRGQMQRQLRQDGGIMDLSPVPRENFGLGSKLKKFVRKVIPNEVAEIATKAAPFVAPFNPAVAAAMAGIGSFDQTGRIGESLKRGALTYGGGQLARFIGGAGVQGNPFTEGGAFRGGLEGFKGGFSSPLGTETGLKLGKSGSTPTKVEGVEGVKQSTFFEDPTLLQEEGLSLGEGLGGGDSILDKGFDLIKKGGKEFFYKDGKLDKTAVIAAVSGAASYVEALALAEDAGTTITEEEYDEAKKAEKKAEYAGYLENFFDSRKDGGRIGFNKGGSRVTQLFKLLEEAETAGDDDKIREIKSDLFKEFNLKLAQGGRIGFARGTDKDPDEIEEFKQLISGDIIENEDPDMRDMDDLMSGGGISFSRQEKSFLFKKLGGSGGSDRSFTMPQLYRILSNPNSPNNVNDARVLKEIAVIGLGGGRKDGGRIGFKKGTAPAGMLALQDYLRFLDTVEKANRGFDEGEKVVGEVEKFMKLIGDKEYDKFSKEELAKEKKLFDKAESVGEMLLKAEDKFGTDFDMQKTPVDAENFGDYARELIRDLNRRDRKLDALAEKAGFKMGGEVPVRKNKVGIEELDYRQSGGFVPVGVKEKADDVPAMLSKNEFVMTADAVRGIGGGSVDKGAEKLYNVMKQAEKVGRA